MSVTLEKTAPAYRVRFTKAARARMTAAQHTALSSNDPAALATVLRQRDAADRLQAARADVDALRAQLRADADRHQAARETGDTNAEHDARDAYERTAEWLNLALTKVIRLEAEARED